MALTYNGCHENGVESCVKYGTVLIAMDRDDTGNQGSVSVLRVACRPCHVVDVSWETRILLLRAYA